MTLSVTMGPLDDRWEKESREGGKEKERETEMEGSQVREMLTLATVGSFDDN
jgi:hypothetical protein